MNRHHYALYVHNCRLVFLLRKDFDQADTFRPAEFHWKLDQVPVVFSFLYPSFSSPPLEMTENNTNASITAWGNRKSIAITWQLVSVVTLIGIHIKREKEEDLVESFYTVAFLMKSFKK